MEPAEDSLQKLPTPDEVQAIIDDPNHPLNEKTQHDICVDDELEQLKEFNDLDSPEILMASLNKQMIMKKCFRVPGATPAQLEQMKKEGKKSKLASRYMHTRRNAFVSAVAMCYNYHLPIIFDPNDVWLAVLQGFRVHLMFHSEKAYVTSTFKDLDKLGTSNKKYLKIAEPALGDLGATVDDALLEEKLFAQTSKACKKMWTDKHKSSGFGSEAHSIDAEEAQVMPVKELTDIFSYVRSSAYEAEAKKAAATKDERDEEAEAAMKAKLAQLKVQSDRELAFYNNVYACQMMATSVLHQPDSLSQQQCGVSRVRFLGTLRDWLILKRKIVYLDRFGCHHWLDNVLPIINKFIAAIFCGEVDKDFWANMYQLQSTSSSTLMQRVWGWICCFFPYTATEPKQQFKKEMAMKKMFRERGMTVHPHMMDEQDFHRGFTASPIKINDKEYFLGTGFCGVEFFNEDDPKYPGDILQYVKPAIGWAIYEEKDEKDRPIERVFLAADTSGKLFGD